MEMEQYEVNSTSKFLDSKRSPWINHHILSVQQYKQWKSIYKGTVAVCGFCGGVLFPICRFRKGGLKAYGVS